MGSKRNGDESRNDEWGKAQDFSRRRRRKRHRGITLLSAESASIGAGGIPEKNKFHSFFIVCQTFLGRVSAQKRDAKERAFSPLEFASLQFLLDHDSWLSQTRTSASHCFDLLSSCQNRQWQAPSCFLLFASQ